MREREREREPEKENERETHTHRETERQRDRETERQREREREKEKEREKSGKCREMVDSDAGCQDLVQLSMSLPSVPPCRLVHGLTPPVALELVAQAVLSAGGRSRSRGGAAQQRGASGASGQRLPVPGSPVCTPPRHPPARPAAHPARPRLRPAPRASPPCLPSPVPPPPPPRSPPPGHPVPSRRAPFRARCLPRAQPQAPAQFPSSPAHAAPGQPPCLGSRSRGGAAQQRGASGVERTAAPRARFPRARQVPACSCPPSRQLRSCHVHFFMFFFYFLPPVKNGPTRA